MTSVYLSGVVAVSDADDVGGEEVDSLAVEVAAGAVLVLGGAGQRSGHVSARDLAFARTNRARTGVRLRQGSRSLSRSGRCPRARGNSSLARLDSTGQITLLATGLAVPAGLAGNGRDLWVSDWATGNVWKVVSNRTVLKSPQLVASGLSMPEGMAVAKDGSLLVVETGKQRLVKINRTSGRVTTLAHHLKVGLMGSAGAPPTYAMSSVAVAPNGTIFVSGDLGSVIYRLTRDS